ncbi:glycosyltransferase family 4 protein [Desulfogranum japonicum]|uniref:glycosyltransferase family 4 protein n=1 Tax=Desulfogranum japonicum TaxID=231447 RepID=UPI0006887C34|nr:glycosyltransferase family 4 protein [Desulfogranum japonicum]
MAVTDADPYNLHSWSGSSYFFFNEFKKRNNFAGVYCARTNLTLLAKLVSFHPRVSTWKFKYNLSPLRYHLLKMGARRHVLTKNKAYDILLQLGSWCDLTTFGTQDVVSYHDGNLAALLNSPHPLPKVPKSCLRRAFAYEKKVYSRVSKIFCFSNWLASSFHNDFDVPYSRLEVVGAGINLPEPIVTKEKNYSSPNILFIGMNFHRKGGPCLLDAFKQVKQEIPGARLKIVTAKKMDRLPDGVEYIPAIDKNSEYGMNQLLELYKWANLFVMPSLYEPFGIVFLEAMAHKIPCIGTRTCAMPEIINHGTTGYLVGLEDGRQLADTITDLLKSPATLKALGEAGYDRVKDRYTWKSVIDTMSSVIATL